MLHLQLEMMYIANKRKAKVIRGRLLCVYAAVWKAAVSIVQGTFVTLVAVELLRGTITMPCWRQYLEKSFAYFKELLSIVLSNIT